MLRIDETSKTLVAPPAGGLVTEVSPDRDELLALVCSSWEAFAGELGQPSLRFVVQGQAPGLEVLAFDEQAGRAVVVGVATEVSDAQLTQALSGAASVAAMDAASLAAVSESLEAAVPGDSPQIVLLASAFDARTLATVDWLTRRHGLEISCFVLSVFRFGNERLLSIRREYPARDTAAPDPAAQVQQMLAGAVSNGNGIDANGHSTPPARHLAARVPDHPRVSPPGRTPAREPSPLGQRSLWASVSPMLLRGLRWGLAGALVAWTLIRLLGLDRVWPVVPLFAFTPWVAALALLAAVVGAVLRWRLFALVCAACGLVLAVAIAPRVVPNRAPEDARGVRLRVLAANTGGVSTSAPELVQALRRWRVDVASLVELPPDSVAAYDANGIGDVLPYRVLRPRPGFSGTGLYSRIPLREAPAPEGTRFAVSAASLAPRGGGAVRAVLRARPRPHQPRRHRRLAP